MTYLVAPRPGPVSSPVVEIKVITPESLRGEKDYLFIGMTWDDYITLAKYLEEVKYKFLEYGAVLDYYEGFAEVKKEGSH